MKFVTALALLFLCPVLVYAQAWSGAEQATVDALSWVIWGQWMQDGLLVSLIIAVLAKR